jgi:hypothetical protein
MGTWNYFFGSMETFQWAIVYITQLNTFIISSSFISFLSVVAIGRHNSDLKVEGLNLHLVVSCYSCLTCFLYNFLWSMGKQ